MRAAALFVVLLCSALTAEAQSDFSTEERNFFNLLFADHSDLGFRYLYQPKNDAEGGEGSYDLHDFTLHFETPLPDDGFFFRLGGELGMRMQQFDEVAYAPTSTNGENLYKVSFLAGMGAFFSSDLLLIGALRPGIYTDFDSSLEEEDFRLYGDAMIVYRFNPGAQVVFGLEYSERFDDTPLIPLIGIRLMNSDGTLRFRATFPTDLQLSYAFDAVSEIYTGVWISGDEYRIDMGDVSSRFDTYVHEERWGVGMRYWVNDSLNLGAEGGVAFGSEFHLKTVDPGQFSDGGVEPTGYISLGAGVAF